MQLGCVDLNLFLTSALESPRRNLPFSCMYKYAEHEAINNFKELQHARNVQRIQERPRVRYHSFNFHFIHPQTTSRI